MVSASSNSNALKLRGYDASDYLRKDEVQTVMAAYQEIERTSPGTYNWVVPEGVNFILVTPVGGGGMHISCWNQILAGHGMARILDRT